MRHPEGLSSFAGKRSMGDHSKTEANGFLHLPPFWNGHKPQAREAREENDITAWNLRSNLPAAAHHGCMPLKPGQPASRNR